MCSKPSKRCAALTLMRKPRAVLDSSALVAAFLRHDGGNAEALQRGQSEYVLCTSKAILDKVRHTLLTCLRIRRRYQYSDSEVEAFLDALPELAIIERDPKDNMVLACAIAARAQYLVTKDHDLLDLRHYKSIEIVSTLEFLERLNRRREQSLER